MLDKKAVLIWVEDAAFTSIWMNNIMESCMHCILCHLSQALAEAFLDHLWKVLQSVSQPAVLRQAAAGYMGSFLARAKFIPVL